MSKDEKKVFFIIPSFRGGGAERATITIASELAKYENLNVTLIALSSDGPLQHLAEDVPLVELKKGRARNAFFALRSYLKQKEPDIVFSVLPQANILVYLIDKITTKSWKTVCMLQNYYERLVSENSFIISWLFTKALEAADTVVPNSKVMAENLVQQTNISPERVHPIYNPINIEEIRMQAKEGVDHEAYNHSPILVGCGSLEKQKGFRYFIEALPEIKKEHKDAQIVLLGEGSLRGGLEQQARDLGVEDSVHFLGFVDNPYKYMRVADVFVLSSLWEGLPTVLIEAMAVGTPVVATDCPTGPKEILKEGSLSQLVPSQNSDELSVAINKVLSNMALKNDLLERSDDFRPDKIIGQYHKVIKKMQ